MDKESTGRKIQVSTHMRLCERKHIVNKTHGIKGKWQGIKQALFKGL